MGLDGKNALQRGFTLRSSTVFYLLFTVYCLFQPMEFGEHIYARREAGLFWGHALIPQYALYDSCSIVIQDISRPDATTSPSALTKCPRESKNNKIKAQDIRTQILQTLLSRQQGCIRSAKADESHMSDKASDRQHKT